MAFEPVEFISGDPANGYLVVCDHASNAVPPDLGDLGLGEETFERHIAYDIGARDLVFQLADRLGAPAVLSRFSRLVIDPNRGLDDPTLLMRLSDGAIIPGNATVGDVERQRRIDMLYRPYHEAVAQAIEAAFKAGRPPALISIHSFTRYWKTTPRPWHAGILWDRDPRLAVPLIEALQQNESIVVGDNEPYSGELRGDTMYCHGTARGLAHALVEVRQDLIGTKPQSIDWANRLADIFLDLRSIDGLNTVCHFGNATH